jgi:hypothetical protein
MPASRLTQIRLRNFKSIGPDGQTVDLKPLTVLIGRNNSGKSTVIQSLLLLKQTLEDPRPEVQLALQGNHVRATSLRELTHGWPENMEGKGPDISLSYVGPEKPPSSSIELRLAFREVASAVVTERGLLGFAAGSSGVEPEGQWTWTGSHGATLVDHFFSALGPMSIEAPKALREFRRFLTELVYVGAERREVPESYPKPTSLHGRTMLSDGMNAPELLYGRRSDAVRVPRLEEVSSGADPFALPDVIVSQTFKEAVEDVLQYLGILGKISFVDVHEMGAFRFLFGRAPLNHVGRGIGHVLPIIVAGILSDPLLGQKLDNGLSLSDYLARCEYTPILAFEELESHLHPKAQTRLAHFLVALARSGRQLIVETHSDHLVRRLRGLVARTALGSESERWLLENVNIVEVDQSPEGVTRLRQAQLTREGWIEQWPADFMDESGDEERAIYYAAAEKSPPEPPAADRAFFEDAPLTDGER